MSTGDCEVTREESDTIVQTFPKLFNESEQETSSEKPYGLFGMFLPRGFKRITQLTRGGRRKYQKSRKKNQKNLEKNINLIKYFYNSYNIIKIFYIYYKNG